MTMSRRTLTQRVRAHYESRAFSPRLVDALCREIDRRIADDRIEVAKGWRLPIGDVARAFEQVEQTPRPAILHPAPAAILAFSFGYRLDAPFARRPDERSPGPNNRALAEMTARCHDLFPEAWIGAQYEVGLALEERGDVAPALVTPPEDWNTARVVDHFVSHLPRYAFDPDRCILVVSHLHHYGRCEFLLAGADLEAFPVPKEVALYADYDPDEAQPRFRSPWEFLVNDFLALCKATAIRHR